MSVLGPALLEAMKFVPESLLVVVVVAVVVVAGVVAVVVVVVDMVAVRVSRLQCPANQGR